ncbi:hypothetical protein TEA_024678 [Camellia sinensis var. sinensis]|uniref:Nuclear condensin complex subunit 3 C-terminal domain-containing protein n=1 Tax=Camellia sinensis var. sinensis TaxID=542762 RepID=A0A4S4ETB1_CAMSN|nr:hypothetical protein TEA_024678 [Camellia sinensis var. sinensis]
MAIQAENEAEKRMMQKIARVLDETRASHATHIRKLKDLSTLRSSSPLLFFSAFSKALTPLFIFQRRNASSERIVRFVAIFASNRDSNNAPLSDSFLDSLLRFLLVATSAANRTVRFRACQIISEIIMRLPDDAEVSNEIWDEVIECMKLRIGDKVPVIRTFAVRALSRFVNDSENGDILDLFLESLPLEQNAEVRKTIVLSLPPSIATSTAIINCTLDVNESVRKAAYCVLASKFPLQSLRVNPRNYSIISCIKKRNGQDTMKHRYSKNSAVRVPGTYRVRVCVPGTAVRVSGMAKEGLIRLVHSGTAWVRFGIKHRTVILRRGLADRSAAVRKECLKLLKDEWLVKCCNGDPIDLLKYLDVETYESVGESVMVALLKDGLVKVQQGQSIFSNTTEGNCTTSIQLMEAEAALYWRVVCRHFQTEAQALGPPAFIGLLRLGPWLSLHKDGPLAHPLTWLPRLGVGHRHPRLVSLEDYGLELKAMGLSSVFLEFACHFTYTSSSLLKSFHTLSKQAKGSDAATTMGTEAAVYAAEASDSNDLLERVLPATISEYIELVKVHLIAGPNYRFASRQLLLLGAMLDFSDVANWKVASSFVQELLQRPLEHEVDENSNKVVIGDGINLGGDRDWAEAVSGLARKVYAASGEFEEVVLRVLEELARPCRERTAEVMQWMHCLAVTGLLLENTKSFRWMQGKAFEPAELLQSLLLPAAKHVHLDVQRVATRCLGLFGLLERKPSEELIKQLRLSFVKGPSPISIMACKALLDLAMWHGPQEVDKAMGQDLSSRLKDHDIVSCTVQMSDTNGDLNFGLLDLLFAGLERDDWVKSADADEHESVQAVIGEGFAKILLLSENYPSIPSSLHPLLLAKLIGLYFSDETKELQRLRQCLSVFFEHYPSLSNTHKRCVSKAFISVMRSIWPGITGNAGGSPLMVSNMRKHAVQASRFMLQMMQAPLYTIETKTVDENGIEGLPENLDGSVQPSNDFENGEEGLAVRIATEVNVTTVKFTCYFVNTWSRVFIVLCWEYSLLFWLCI